ncbi:Chitin synthase C [Anabarilius grahami]|uniref:chitin synthase n=1 Tax=Anabarilius grahami TaxID=495550 RepID=A0A3N0XTR8_ANAGA|nr:Chitin synthase C [Anabarilius grahami]
MEELKQRRQKREGRHRDTWDPFQLNPIGAEKEKKRICFRILQNLVAVIVGLLVLVSGVVSKGSLLVLTTLSSPKSLRSEVEQQLYTLLLMCVLLMPNLLMFLKSLWKCLFKNYVAPNPRTLGIMCVIESLVGVGTAVLVLIVMPKLDILTNLCIPGGICILSAVFQIAFRLQTRSWMIIYPISSLILVLSGYALLGIDYYVRDSTYVPEQMENPYVYVGIAIFASVLVSLNWWENPFQASTNIQEMLKELDSFRDSVYLFTSLLRIAVTLGVYFLYFCLFAENPIDWDAYTQASKGAVEIGLGLFFLQAFCSAACHWFGVVACKIHAVKYGFALPVSLIGPVTIILGITLFLTQADHLLPRPETITPVIITVNNSTQYISTPFWQFCYKLDSLKDINTTPVVMLEISKSICKTSLNNPYDMWPFSMLVLEGVCMWLGLVSCTYYVWKIKVQRIERTSQLFVRRLYESAFIDLSMLLNTKMKVIRTANKERLDRYRGDPKEEHKDVFDFECHIYVDDAFMIEKDEENGTETRLVNSYVSDLVNVVMEVYRVFTNKEPDEVSIIETPYGGRLVFVMPEGNMLYVHLKDKALIRNKKRWSQIMYLYYLLGWKGYNVKNPQKITRQNNPSRASLISLDSETYLLPNHDNDSKRKHISDDNTYIMALDGDTDFQPGALILLVDRLRMYDNVGAACGRIHPTGMGPMVWYQKFEYAVGHWLQKTAEHVFGSVLCSPGCFSLFRGSALMDDNVLKRYTTKATRASEYVQYDQGEDRWLCTLLLQQGWRVEYNAASDAYTNSPQEFKEFYNQRRRWGPSTLANTLDLLHNGRDTVKRNTSISMLYILYQMFTVASSILGPASVTLMVAGAFQFVFKISGTLSIIIAVIPPTVYMIICFVAKPNFQITIAAILSVIYAFLMTASFFSIIGDMVIQQTFITPTGLFLVSGAILYVVTAILHPQETTLILYGLMYFICIPSGYLLLTIYSLVNMHIVSWGTRETSKGKEQKKQVGVVCNRDCKMCCWDVKIQVTQETENLLLQQIQHAVNPNTPAAKTEPEVPLDQITQEEQSNLDKNKRNLDNQEMRHKKDESKENLNKDNKEKDSDSERRYLPFHVVIDHLANWVEPVKREFLKKLTYANLKRNLQEQIRYTLRNKNQEDLCEELVQILTDTLNEELKDKVGPEDVLTETQLEELQYSLNEAARRIVKANRIENGAQRLERRVKRGIERTLVAPQVEKLSEDETDFWNKLLERYLKPINDDKAHLEEVTRELKSLRNKAVFLYFIVNVLWVVATFFLQAIGGDVLSIEIPKYDPINKTLLPDPMKVEPLSLMFLLSFAVLLIVQFLAMLYHRVYTLIHVVSYRGTEKNYKEKDEASKLSFEDEDDALILGNPIENTLVITSDDL